MSKNKLIGICKICSATNILAEYHGESGFNAVHCLAQHEDNIRHKRKKNAIAKHLDNFHPEEVGDADNFNFSSVRTFKKRLERQISEGVSILKTNAEVSNDRQQRILMNSKNEHRSLQPAVHSTSVSRQTRNGSWLERSSLVFENSPGRKYFLFGSNQIYNLELDQIYPHCLKRTIVESTSNLKFNCCISFIKLLAWTIQNVKQHRKQQQK